MKNNFSSNFRTPIPVREPVNLFNPLKISPHAPFHGGNWVGNNFLIHLLISSKKNLPPGLCINNKTNTALDLNAYPQVVNI